MAYVCWGSLPQLVSSPLPERTRIARRQNRTGKKQIDMSHQESFSSCAWHDWVPFRTSVFPFPWMCTHLLRIAAYSSFFVYMHMNPQNLRNYADKNHLLSYESSTSLSRYIIRIFFFKILVFYMCRINPFPLKSVPELFSHIRGVWNCSIMWLAMQFQSNPGASSGHSSSWLASLSTTLGFVSLFLLSL